MKIGTKSVLFGAHFFLTHWLFVARGWYQLYGFRRVWIGQRDVRDDLETYGGQRYENYYRKDVYASLWNPALWVAFMVHDLGYWGKPNMDGAEGERHPEWACGFMNEHFGEPWGAFVLDHSRFYAKKHGRPLSPLCYADKLAIVMEPSWFYLPRVRLTGEIHEYKKMAGTNSQGKVTAESDEIWHKGVKDYCRKWVEEHKDGRLDAWTTAQRDT
jgi:hypothetical protein